MDELHFDPMQVLVDDLDVFEAITKQAFEAVDWQSPGGGVKLHKGIYYLVMRQNDPNFTVDSMKGLTLGRLAEVAEAFTAMQPNPTAEAAAS